MTGSLAVATGIALLALCWMLLFASSRRVASRRNIMVVVLAAFLLGLLGLLLVAVGTGGDPTIHY